jgi:hypothetical protein
LVIKKKDIDHHDEHTDDHHVHEHDDHDSDTVAYEFFKSEVDGSHIRIVSIDQNFVSFGEYES